MPNYMICSYASQNGNITFKINPSQYNTTSTISASDLMNGVVKCNPTTDITLTFDTAQNIWNAMGNNDNIGIGISCRIMNYSSHNVTLSSNDANLDISGLVSTVIPANSSRTLFLFVVNTTPTIEVCG